MSSIRLKTASQRQLNCLCCVLLALALWPEHVSSQTALAPELVSAAELGLEEFEPSIRDQLLRTYEDAQTHAQDAAATGKLGMVFQTYGKYDLAERCYRRAVWLDPRSFRWTYYLGVVDGMLGRSSEAQVHLRAAMGLNPSYAPAQVRLARLLFDSGDLEQSAAVYRAALQQNARLASAHFGLGQVLAAQRKWQAAIASFLRACEIADQYAAAQYALAMAYRSTGDMAQAATHLERYQRFKNAKQPSEDPVIEDINRLYAGGLTHFAAGSTLAQQGKPREAAAEFEAALRRNPRLVMAHINLIAMYGRLNLPSKAEEHFRTAIDLDPGWVEAYYNWGMFLAQAGRKAEAADAFRRAIEVNPNYAGAHFQLGMLLDEAENSENAAREYERTLALDPNHRQAHYYLARNRARAGRAQDAIQHLLATIRVEDEWTPFCMRALALAYEQAGDREQALFYTRAAQQRALSLKLKDLASEIERDLDRLARRAAQP